MVVGSIVVVVNLPTLSAPIRLDPDAIAGIYLGSIARWDAPPLRTLNPGVALPAIAIHPVRRARTSGTSEIFAEYLATSRAWSGRERRGPDEWPAGDIVEGNEGIAAQVRAIVGAIGFVEHSYAVQSRLAVAALRNASGAFVLPDSASLALTAEELLAGGVPDSLHGLVGARQRGAYPVAALTRLVADRALGEEHRASHFLAFARWALEEGGTTATKLGYVPLPRAASRAVRARLDRLTPGRCPAPRVD
jgi:phosphate transport system substrate-binding protein